MSDYGRRIVVDAAYDTVIRTLNEAIRAEGLEILAEVDVREHFGRKLVHDFRRYAVVQAWSPEIAMDVLRHDLDAGTVLATTFAVYELADGETAVVANGTFAAYTEDNGWRGRCPTLAALADRETRRLARVFDGIERAANRRSRVA
jgi:uncharacterized protein (DUF302 family)